MTKKKYYVVWQGNTPGIFDNWEACKKSIKGYENAKYKSFTNLDIAKKAYTDNPINYIGKSYIEPKLSKQELKVIGLPNTNSISVDAACSGNPGIMEYQGVETFSKKVLFKKGPFKDATNNIGEFLALVHALAYLKKNNDTRPIYSDSKIAIGWVKNKKAKTNINKTPHNNVIFILLQRAEKWLNNNTYPNKIIKWETKAWGEIPADFGRK